jgi:hypothetical protein
VAKSIPWSQMSVMTKNMPIAVARTAPLAVTTMRTASLAIGGLAAKNNAAAAPTRPFATLQFQ